MKFSLTISHMGKYEDGVFSNVSETLEIDSEAIAYKNFAVVVNHLCLSWINIVEIDKVAHLISVFKSSPHRLKSELVYSAPFLLNNNVYSLKDEVVLSMVERFNYVGFKSET